MASQNVLNVTLAIRNDLSTNWSLKNPKLTKGEAGYETDTGLMKIGDGSTYWSNLPYVNKLDDGVFTRANDGTISLTTTIANKINNAITTSGGNITGALTITNSPTNANDVVNKSYVDSAVANAGQLKKEIVNNLPQVANAEANTIYMILDTNVAGADKYREYMLIGGELVQIGDTSIDLTGLITGGGTAGHIVSIGADGSLVDSGYTAAALTLNPATTTTLGGVLASSADNYINVDNTGLMYLNRVSTTKLYVPQGDELVLNGGQA